MTAFYSTSQHRHGPQKPYPLLAVLGHRLPNVQHH